jgi:hypothetical protein
MFIESIYIMGLVAQISGPAAHNLQVAITVSMLLENAEVHQKFPSGTQPLIPEERIFVQSFHHPLCILFLQGAVADNHFQTFHCYLASLIQAGRIEMQAV